MILFWSIIEFTIPKGSKYYYNPSTQEYLSNQIILNKEPL